MKKIQIVYALDLFGRESFCETLSEFSNYQIVNFKDLIKESLRNSKAPLISTIKNYVDNGEIIPSKLLNEFIINEINGSNDNKIIVGYPMLAEQFELFTKSLVKLNIELTKSWLIDYQDINFIIKKEMEIKGEVHCKKVNWTIDDEKKITLERLAIFRTRMNEIEQIFKVNINRVDISESNNHKESYLKQIKMHNTTYS